MTKILNPSRRRFLQALGVGAAALPVVTLPGFVQAAGATPRSGNILILVELAGGNDGLNTVVPIRDDAYRALRPEIGLSARETLNIDGDTGLHPSLRRLSRLWDKGQLQIVEGVGYPDPNRSHFRSIEIWNAGLGAQAQTSTGWIANAFEGHAPQAEDVDGLVLGGEMGPLAGPGRFSSLRNEETFVELLEALPGGQHPVRPQGTHPLAHVLKTYERAEMTGDRIAAKLERSRTRRWDFPESELGEQLRSAARLLDAGVDVPVLKVVQGGYDTHEAQPDMHGYLLMDLSEAVAAFESAMRDIGLWDQVTIVTYSEFGRTARENASGGTDHGTAAPVFVMGGGVAGGLTGARPRLDRLVEDDLVHTTDYRLLYDAILTDLWDVPGQFASPGAANALRLRA